MIPFPTSEPTVLVTPWFVAPGATPFELTAMNAVQWLRLAIEMVGAIAVIRTALSYFLSLELREADRTMASEKVVEKHDVAAGGTTRG